MSSETRWQFLLPRTVRQFPVDLAAAVVVVVLAAGSVFLPGVRETPLRLVFGLLALLFAPGYAFVAALFPAAGGPKGERGGGTGTANPVGPRGVDGIERIALSVVSSVALVGLAAFALVKTSIGVHLASTVPVIGVITVAAAVVAASRRLALREEARFTVPYREWLAAITPTERGQGAGPANGALSVLLVVALLVAVTSVAFAAVVPDASESYTEAYLLTKSGDGGSELVLDDYPTDLVAGEEAPLVIGVTNHEFEPRSYAVVVQLQRVDVESDTAVESEELERFSLQIDHGEEWTREHTITPTMTGDRLRLTYLVYRGTAPANPTVENAYREVHLWVGVSDPASGESAAS